MPNWTITIVPTPSGYQMKVLEMPDVAEIVADIAEELDGVLAGF